MRSVQFTKMQGLGNDFIIVEGPMVLEASTIAEWCDRRFGIGADGLLVVSRVDPIRMEYFNADGSVAEMCGNGLRCVARYAYDRGWANDRNFAVATPVGARTVRVREETIEVELGRIEITGRVELADREFHLVNVGNPHAVTLVDDPETVDLAQLGPALQPEFGAGINVEVVAVEEGRLKMRIWERGVGETLACGTGMAAAVAATQTLGLTSGSVATEVPGGVGVVEIRDGVAWLSGPAEYSFRGTVGEQ